MSNGNILITGKSHNTQHLDSKIFTDVALRYTGYFKNVKDYS